MASLAQTVFLSSCILLLGGITEAQATSALIYTEQDEYRSGSVLHRLELPKSCVTCLFNCAKSCPRDRPLSFSWSDVEIGPVDFLYGDSKVFFFNKKSRMIESIGYTASSSTSKVSQHKLCSDKVNGIAVDWIGRNLFYTDARKRALVVTSLRRSASRLLVYKDLEEPHGVAVDASRGTVCWTDMGKKMVECLRLNDMARTTVYSHRLEEPSGVTFDFTTGDLYWADRGRATIYRADPDGSDVKTVLVAQGTRFNGLTFLENITFVIDRASSSSRKIYMCQTGSCESTLQYLDAKVNSEIIDLTFYDNRRQSQSGTCSSPSCSGGMCVMTGGYASRCLCPAGKKSQGSSCVDSDEFPSPSFVYSIGNAICLDHVLQVEDDSRSSTSGCFERSSGDVSALCVHSASKTVYYYSKGSSSIRKRHLDKQSSSTVAISSPGDVTDLAVDQSTDTLYWTLMNQNLIRVGRAGVSMTWKSTSRPYAITVHAEKRKVFWSTMSARPSLNQASLDGSGIRQIISGGLRNPSQLAFDGDDRLYWIDKQDSSIYSVSLDGADKEKHFYRNGAFGIAVWQGYLAWTETGPTSIRWGINDDYNVMPTGRHDYTDGRSAGPISLFEDKDKTVGSTELMPFPNALPVHLYDPQDRFPRSGDITVQEGASGPCVQPGNGGCEQFCFARSSTVGVCRCGSGFSLQSDFTSCTAPGCTVLSRTIDGGRITCTDGARVGSRCSAMCDQGYQAVGGTIECMPDKSWSGMTPRCPGTECQSLSSPINGFWRCSNGWKINSVCAASCDTGYSLSGDYSATCESTGTWSSHSPVCTVTECPSLRNLLNGNWDCTNGRRYNSVCTATCKTGYSRTGDYSATCQSTGYWTSYSPSCSVVECPILSNPANGNWDCTNGRKYNSVCIALCNSGYSRSGDYSATCQSTGHWTSYSPSCSVIECPSLRNLINGNWVCTNGRRYNSVCTATCKTGYSRTGDNSATCQSTGYWTSYSPSCTVVECSSLSNPANGKWDCTNGIKYNSVCIATCNSGYNRSGDYSATCQSTGHWTSYSPSCSVIECRVLSRPANGQWNCSNGRKYNSVCTATCYSGYSRSGDYSATCQSTGYWTSFSPSCSSIQCPSLGSPTNGKWDCTNGFQYNSVCTAKCNAGYTRSGDYSATCQSNGYWTSYSPLCLAIQCSSLGNPTNGKWDCTNGFQYNSVCTAKCNAGYTRSGDYSATCQSNGYWTSISALCSAIQCSSLGNPTNGKWDCTNGFQYNSVCTAKCNAGYTRSGVYSATCQSNGYWTSNSALCSAIQCSSLGNPTNGKWDCTNGFQYNSVCTAKCNAGYTRSGDYSATCQSNGYWTSNSALCSAIQCSSLGNPTNGKWDCTNGFQYNSVCTAKCNAGYTRSGDYSATCQSNGYWTSYSPLCSAIKCSSLGNPTNGKWDCTNGFQYNSVCTAKCQVGYTRSGDFSATCQSNGYWTSYSPSCLVTHCQDYPTISDGYWDCTAGRRYKSNCTAKCHTGHNLSGSPSISCLSDGTWTDSRASCPPSVHFCREPGRFSDGSWSCTRGKRYRSVCTAKCNIGFTLAREATVECKSDQMWTNANPLCSETVDFCPGLTTIANGHWECPTKRKYRSVCTAKCYTGYNISGTVTTSCQSDNTWTKSNPTCTPVENFCARLPDITNGTWHCPDRRRYDAECTALCEPGYSRTGIPVTTCQSNRRWTPATPECKVSEDHCDPEPALSHGYWSCSDLRKYRSSCQARCETGYVIKGNPSIVCQRGGNWTGSNAECEESDSFCPPYPTITRGKWTCDRGRRYRSSCTLSCSSGYTVSGSNKITCQSDKKWSSSYSFCDLVPSYCSSLSDPPNGTWDCPDGTKYQSTCTAKCHTGYNLSGSATKICLSNKTWTRADPVCNVSFVFCPPKMDPVNGYWDCPDKRKFRSVCSARCASGYTLFGNPTSTCQSDGQWSSGKTACEFSECAAIQNPANGHWNCPQGHGLNATCTVECDPGYELRGQRARRCQRNGIWSGSNPSCKESISHCPELPGLPNGHWECTKGRALHSSCTAKCHTGFSLTGDPNTRCRINKTWDESSPVCSKRTCPNREIPNNATRTCTGQSAGAVCTTTCNFGHLPVDGDSFVTCDQNLTWSGTQPKCIESPCGHLEMVKPAVLMKCERDESNGHITCRAHCNKPNMITEGSISRTCVPGRDWTGKPLKCSKPVSGGEPGMLPIIIGTAAAGGLLLLLVVVITIACCCRRRERPEDPYMYVSPDQINTGGYDPYCPECATKGVTCDNHKPLQRPPPPARRSYVRNRAYTGPYEELNPGNMAPNPYNKLGMVRVLPQT